MTTAAPESRTLPQTSPPLEERERLRIAGRRARSLVYLLLARRGDLRVRVAGDGEDVPLDFAVNVGPGNVVTRRFDIIAPATLDDDTFEHPEHIASLVPEAVWPDLPFPVLAILVHAIRDEMKYRWLLRPDVHAAGYALSRGETDWEPLNPRVLDGLIVSVKCWWDAVRADRKAA